MSKRVEVKYKCWLCDGKGKWQGDRCYRCENGLITSREQLMPCIGGPLDGQWLNWTAVKDHGYIQYNRGHQRGRKPQQKAVYLHETLTAAD